jgi:hypothetical protein
MNYYTVKFSYRIGTKPYDAHMVVSVNNPIVTADLETWFNSNVEYNQDYPLHMIVNRCTEAHFESQPNRNKIKL